MMMRVNGAAWGGLLILFVVGLLAWNLRRPPAVRISMQADRLVVTMLGWDVVYTCRRQIAVPFRDVAGVCVARRDGVPAEGLRMPGTGIPGVIRAGSFGRGNQRDFWDVRRAPEVLVIQLKPDAGEYRRIVVEVPDAHSEMLRLRPVVGAAALPLPPMA